MTKKIHLFRHGITDWNLAKKMQGHSDISLNAEGRRQASDLQTYFANNPVDLFFSSDLVRAVETAQLANAKLNCPINIHSGLREANLGELEGLSIDEAHRYFGKEAWETWSSMDPQTFDFAFPRGESSNQVIKRLTETIQSLCENTEFTSAGLCTHGFAMRRFLHSLNPDLKSALPIPNCVVYTINWDIQKKYFNFSI